MTNPQMTEFERIAKAAHPKSKHPHYGIEEARTVIRALTACGYSVVREDGRRLAWDEGITAS